MAVSGDLLAGNVHARSSLSPLIMFAAGPGTITVVVTLAAVRMPDRLPITAIVAAVMGAGKTLAALLLAIQSGIASQPEHAGHSHPLHGAHWLQFVLAGLKVFLRT